MDDRFCRPREPILPAIPPAAQSQSTPRAARKIHAAIIDWRAAQKSIITDTHPAALYNEPVDGVVAAIYQMMSVVFIKNQDDQDMHPPGGRSIQPNETLVVLGTRTHLNRLMRDN